MNPLKQIAHTYILQTIGKLDDDTARQVIDQLVKMKLTNGKRTIEDELDIFAAEQSVRVHAIAWIKDQWNQDIQRDPKMFADEILDDFMTTLD